MDAMKLVKIEPRADDAALGVTTFAVAPGVAYPAALEDLSQRIDEKQAPSRYITMGGEIRENPLATIYFPAAQQLGAAALALGGKARWDCTTEQRPLRAAALELARLWFTEHLHQAHDYKPLRVHILKDERFRL